MKKKIVLITSLLTLLISVGTLRAEELGIDEVYETTSSKADIMTLTSENYNKETAKGLVIVDFWAPWCAPCRKMGPSLEEVAKQRKDVVKVGKLNIDNYKSFIADNDISSIPTIVVYKDGKEVARYVGQLSTEQLNKIVDTYSTSK